MADESTKSRKSGRTAEQEAARAARKAAKKAAAAEAAAAPAAEASDEAAAEPAAEAGSKKRRAEDEGDNADLLEIDLGAEAPMSKAEIRAARKRAKRGDAPLERSSKPVGENDKDAGDETKRHTGEKALKEKTPKATKGEWSVWVGNIAFRTTPDSLKEFVEKGIVELGGEADSVTRVNLPKKPGNGSFAANKGFAYVDLKTEALQSLAIGLSERPFDGRRLLIKAGNDHKANPDARTPKPSTSAPGNDRILAQATQKHPESATLFIGNLPFDVTEDELRDLVEGNAEDIEDEEEEEEVKEEEKEEKEEGGEEEGEGEDEDGEAKPKAPAAMSSRSGIKSGLIKTRLAQFEDTGRCKGFAFWDFKSALHAKRAVLNRKNHYLRGNRLNLQFASEEAQKRSGGRRGDGGGRGRGGARGGGRGGRPQREPRYFEQDGGEESHSATGNNYESERGAQSRIAASFVSGGDDAATSDSARGGDKRGKKWESKGRQAPGAALAMAKREKVGIVASEGSKVTFD